MRRELHRGAFGELALERAFWRVRSVTLERSEAAGILDQQASEIAVPELLPPVEGLVKNDPRCLGLVLTRAA